MIPESYQGSEFLMLGNVDPGLQISVVRQMRQRPKLIAMDTMNFLDGPCARRPEESADHG